MGKCFSKTDLSSVQANHSNVTQPSEESSSNSQSSEDDSSLFDVTQPSEEFSSNSQSSEDECSLDIENPTIKISLLDRDVECELEAAQHIGAINVMLSNMDRERWTTETIPLKKVDYIQYCLILHWISKPHTSSNDEEIDDIVQWELNFLDEISQKYPERFLRLIKLANYLDIPTLYTATTAHAAYMLTQCKPDAIPAAMSQEKLQSFTRKLPFEHDDDDDD
ncbi:uncharacterized protein LOC116349741 isoform X2 [Contarinia nasturtii]|uniref:uncharacterized protein LOC116349741 isoform X2 n=1 Tax=Contarinia nasturtii TaxID=265458 RepID=UPI0012D47217|nr:uncharacterized protein LOC116349741 isoform X2 [Contarinia nasturtii]